jgi:hypothetical protein
MKTPRANRRRRTPRRRQRGGATDREMGFHLGSDVLHDFGALYKFKNVQYHSDPVQPITQDEPIVVAYFSDKGEDIGNRKDASITFTVPKNTSVFGSWTPPNLTGVENGAVGIVYDAGDKITKQLGARNVITFGSVLDPSKKPVLGPDDPIWFDVGVGTAVDIPLTMFGFDHTKIRSLEITNFIGTSTCAIFNTSAGRFDAISGPTPPANPAVCTPKPINESRASKVGYFVSIKEAKNNVATLLVKDNPEDDQRAMFYLAGKTLGDTMLVASCMPKFTSVPNLFHLTNARRQIGEGGAVEGGVWKKLSGGEIQGDSPSTLILKTQDRLNHTRALIMKVPSILQSKFEYTFVPGIVDTNTQIEVYKKGYTRLKTGLANRYDELIESLNVRLRGMVDADAGKVITGGIIYTFKDEFKKALARNLIDKIVGALESIRDGVIAAYDADKEATVDDKEATVDDKKKAETLKSNYEKVYKKYNKLAPATTSIFDDDDSLERHIVVSLGGGVIPKKLMIDFMTDFQGIARAQAGGPTEWVIKGDASKLLEQTGESMRAAATAAAAATADGEDEAMGRGEGAATVGSNAAAAAAPPVAASVAAPVAATVGSNAAAAAATVGEDEAMEHGEGAAAAPPVAASVAAAPVVKAADDMEDVQPVPPEFDMTKHFKNLETMFLRAIGIPEAIAGIVSKYKSVKQRYQEWVSGPNRANDSVSYDINEVYVGAFLDNPPAKGGKRGYVAVCPRRENAGTLLNDFIKYASQRGGVDGRLFERTARTIDKSLWSELLGDYEYATKETCSPGNGSPNRTSILFNAFVCHINATNSMLDNPGFETAYADQAIAVDTDYNTENNETDRKVAEIRKQRRGEVVTPPGTPPGTPPVAPALASEQRLAGKQRPREEDLKDQGRPKKPALEEGAAAAARRAAAATAAAAEARHKAAEKAMEAQRKAAQAAAEARHKPVAAEGDGDAPMSEGDGSAPRSEDEAAPATQGGTRRKKRAGTYRKKRKDKGTL